MSPQSWISQSQLLQDKLKQEIAQSETDRQARKQAFMPTSVPTTALPTDNTQPWQSNTPMNWQPQTQWQPPQPTPVQTPTMPVQTAVRQPTSQQTPVATPVSASTTVTPTTAPKAVSKTNIFTKYIAPALKWWNENVDKPFAATISSPFSTKIAWTPGESWLSHNKKQYDAWKVNGFIKGAIEMANPIYWLPIAGWAAKGLGVFGEVGEVAGKVILGAEKVVNLPGELAMKGATKIGSGVIHEMIPTEQLIKATMFKDDAFKRLSLLTEKIPGLRTVTKLAGGEAAFARNTSDVLPALDPFTHSMVAKNAKGELVALDAVGLTQLSVREVQKATDPLAAFSPAINRIGNPIKVLEMDDVGRVLAATPKPEYAKFGNGLSDVIEHPDYYTFSTPKAQEMAHTISGIAKDSWQSEILAGVRDTKQPFKFNRLVKGKEVILPDGTLAYDESIKGTNSALNRTHEHMIDGMNNGVIYDNDPMKALQVTLHNSTTKIANKNFDNAMSKYGMTIQEKVASYEPELMNNLTSLAKQKATANYTAQTLRSFNGSGGTYIAGAKLAKIEEQFPEVAAQIRNALALKPDEATKLMDNIAREVGQTTKIGKNELRIAATNAMSDRMKTTATLISKPANWTIGDIEEGLRQIGVNNSKSIKAIENAYKSVYQSRKDIISTTFKDIVSKMETASKDITTQISPLKVRYNEIATPYKNGGQALGQFETMGLYGHPALKNKIFPTALLQPIQKFEKDAGQKWLSQVSKVSGVSRTLVASMDASAGFIQGLPVLGRDPVLWGKSMVSMFRSMASPKYAFEWGAREDVQAVAREMMKFGGSPLQTSEYFTSLPEITKTLGKIPKAGKAADWAVEQTFGRTGLGFTFFGDNARVELYKALRRPNMTDTQLVDLVRTVERMTGVMSPSKLLIGKTQQQFESGFMLFASRYTRAGLALSGDVLKGGLSGSEARKALGAMMGGGAVFYYGVCKELGQEPQLDPTSSKFMTVKIGNSNIGVGGIYYALTRLMGNVTGTMAQAAINKDPSQLAVLSPLNLSRTDNPLYSFLSSRASPVTNMLYGAVIDHKTFLGQPLETPVQYGQFLASFVTPISLQPLTGFGQDKSAPVFVANLMGLRTFPKSASVMQDEARDTIAQQTFGMPYANLDLMQKRQVEQNPTIVSYQNEIDKQTTLSGNAMSVAYLDRQRERDQAFQDLRDRVQQLQNAVDAGVITPVNFKDELSYAKYGYGETLNHIDTNPQYADILKQLSNPKSVTRNYTWELAYDELVNAMYKKNPDGTTGFEDQYGTFDFKKYNEFMNQMQSKYGGDLQTALQYQAEKYKDFPAMYQEYEKAKQILKPYWQVQDEVETTYGKAQNKWQQIRIDSLVSRIKKRMKLADPQIAKYYDMFYATQ